MLCGQRLDSNFGHGDHQSILQGKLLEREESTLTIYFFPFSHTYIIAAGYIYEPSLLNGATASSSIHHSVESHRSGGGESSGLVESFMATSDR